MAMEFGETAKDSDEQVIAAPSPEAPENEIEEIEVEEIDISQQEPVSEVDSSAVDFDLLSEPVAGEDLEPGSLGERDETPSFSEEPIALGEGAEPETDDELEFEVEVEDELESEPEPELESEPEEPIEEEDQEVEVEIETEPEMAADGINPLVGLLGDDIDSLVDSIIYDVESSKVGIKTPSPPATTRIPLFSDLTAEEFVDVAIMLVRRAEKAGTVIVREGDPGDSMFIVSTGEVDATRVDAGQQVKLATLSDGDFFGEMAVLTGEPRTATVSTVRNTELLELSRNDLQTICTRHPEVEAKLRLAADERRMKSSP
jgi:hypothetical protein